MRRLILILLGMSFMLPGRVLSHDAGENGNSIWLAYSFDPWVILPMLILAVSYLAGLLRLWRRAGKGRGVAGWRVGCFAGAMLALMLALIWPFDMLADRSLAAHMTQHVLLTTVAAPLIAASAPLTTCLWAFPAAWRPAVASLRRLPGFDPARRLLLLPTFSWLLYAAVLWFWHMPRFYVAATENLLLHRLEHICFFASALVLWWTALHLAQSTTRMGIGVFLLFSTALHEGLLGALLTFSSRPLYAPYAQMTDIFGLEPLQDQQAAGLVMWLGGGIIYLVAILLLVGLWLQRFESTEPSRPDRCLRL